MAKLFIMRTTGGKEIEIIKSVAPIWQDLGDMLDFDDSGSWLSAIEKDHHGDPEACCRAMFQHWIKGYGLPCTWRTLIGLLRDLDREVLAEEIKSALSASGILYLHAVCTIMEFNCNV